MSRPYFHLDESSWPIVVFRFQGDPTDEEFEAYLKAMEGLYARDERFTMVFDARGTVNLKAKHRRRQADWLKQHAARIRRLNPGSAFIIDSPFVRGLLTAILWLQPLPVPHKVFSSMDEAVAWCRDRLQRGSAVSAPPGP